MRASPKRRRRPAFTLVEVLLVLVILVIIGSLAVTAYGPIQDKANKKAAMAQIKLFENSLRFYRADLNNYPLTQQGGLEALREPPADLTDPDKWQGPYLEDPVPVDPWDNPYQYVSPGTHNPDGYDVWSFGPDGIDGTEDDIGNWNLSD